ncbi:MAG: hypothetical protein K2X06_12495 [Burkholderiales bacterium]|nr:hypothetical protein [Burkholderiales bacterium]
MDKKTTPHGKVAYDFAVALISGRFAEAHELLAASQKIEWSAEALHEELVQMTDYGSGPPTEAEVMEVMEDWPAKKPGDIGWAYAAIAGPGYSEAVAVVVARENGRLCIREIEWGRP